MHCLSQYWPLYLKRQCDCKIVLDFYFFLMKNCATTNIVQIMNIAKTYWPYFVFTAGRPSDIDNSDVIGNIDLQQ